MFPNNPWENIAVIGAPGAGKTRWLFRHEFTQKILNLKSGEFLSLFTGQNVEVSGGQSY